MTTYNVSHPFPDGLNLPQNSGGATSAKTDAWRKAFEKEQESVLRNAKSVRLGGTKIDAAKAHSNATFLTPKDQSSSLASKSEAPLQDTSPKNVSFGKHVASTENGSGYRTTYSSPQVIFGSLFQAGARTPTSGALSNFNSSEVSGSIAALEERMKQKWLLKHIHLASVEGGVKVWIRDADLSPSGTEVQALAERIKGLLQAEGQELVGFVLNGHTIQ